MKESVRYLHNAKDILKNVPVEDNRYTDVRLVQEAFGTAYLALLKAIDEYLLNRGLSRKELPRSVDACRGALKKYPVIHDGKLVRQFEALYDELHIAGYYRGLITDVNAVKDILKSAQSFIEKVSPR